MWGALQKNAQALASIAAEQAQKGIASANQLLEKLDGQLDGEEDDEDNEDDESNNNDPKHVTKVTDEEDSSDDRTLTKHTVDDEDVVPKRNKDTTSPVGDSKINQMSAMHYDDNMDKSIDDELDQLLLDDDAIDTDESKIAAAEASVIEKPSLEVIAAKGDAAEKVKVPSVVPRADERPVDLPQKQGKVLAPPVALVENTDQVRHLECSCILTFVRISIMRRRCLTHFYEFTGRVV
jgi:hypothetical protein